MDAVQFLKQEHEKAKAALATLSQTGSPTTRSYLWRQLKPELELHEKMEETCLYGPLAGTPPGGTRSLPPGRRSIMRRCVRPKA